MSVLQDRMVYGHDGLRVIWDDLRSITVMGLRLWLWQNYLKLYCSADVYVLYPRDSPARGWMLNLRAFINILQNMSLIYTHHHKEIHGPAARCHCFGEIL